MWLGGLAVGIITSDLVSTSSLAVSIMPGGAALSNGVAVGGAAFASSLGLALACIASITASTIEGTSSCTKFSFGWARVSCVAWLFFPFFPVLGVISTILIVQLICCTGGVFTLLFTWQLLRMRYMNWCLPLLGA